MLSRPNSDLTGKYVIGLLPDRSKHKMRPGSNNLFSEEETLDKFIGAEFIGTLKDKSQFPVEIKISPIESGLNSEETGLATFRDIIDRKNKEEIVPKQFMRLACSMGRLGSMHPLFDAPVQGRRTPMLAEKHQYKQFTLSTNKL